jgi:SAM-dependent methyltransferase
MAPMPPATEGEVASYWDANPCGTGQFADAELTGRDYFESYDRARYAREGHIIECIDAIDWHGKSVLEIGLGHGAESELLVRRGARWTGLDLTPAAVNLTRTRLTHLGQQMPVSVGSAMAIPHGSSRFDVVFSHGVLHHLGETAGVPNILHAQQEIARVLKPGGELICMLYAKWSLNYLLSIAVLRRLALLGLYPFVQPGDSMVGKHIRNAKRIGLANYLRLRNFVHYNTDGPDNPFAQVYDEARIRRDFPAFTLERTYKRFPWAPPLPRLSTSGRWLGWHLWAHLRVRK